MHRVIGLAGLIFFAAAADVTAAAPKKKKNTAWVMPTHIQMVPMIVPAGKTSVPMTFYLEAKKRERGEAICKRMPQIRDAVLRALSRKPIPVHNRRLVLKGLAGRMLKPVNKAVGAALVKRIYVAKGAVRMGTGKIKQRPFAVIDGCVNILLTEKEREQAAKKR